MLKLRERISKGENRTTEFKREVPVSLKNILKTIIAFANDAGGDILVGIDNNSNIMGIKEDTLFLEERISNSVHDNIYPIPSIYYKVINIGEKQIFNVKIFPGVQKPYYLKRDGLEHGVYIRIGSTNKKADASIINELRRQNLNMTYDEEICHQQSCEYLSGELLRIFANKYGDVEITPLDILIRDKYVQKTNSNCYPTVGAVLLFSETLPSEFEYASITINQYYGPDRANLESTIQIKKGLLKIVSLVIDELKNILWTKIKIENIERNDQLEIPELSIREAVINAICHRDYSIVGSSTKIDVFTDRLEIISPGNLPVGITLEELGQGASEIRNKIIAKAFRRFGYIEKLGTGISRMLSLCKKAGIPLPIFEEPGRYFKVTFFRRKDINIEFENDIIKQIKKSKEMKAKEISNILNVHPNTILNYLRVMIDNGIIEKIGKGPNVRYRIKM